MGHRTLINFSAMFGSIPIDSSQALALRPDVVATVLEEGAVLLDLESKYFYAANTTGWAISQLFEAGTTLERVQAECRNWGAQADDEGAIEGAVDVLVSNGLVTPVDHETTTQVDVPEPWVAPSIERQAEPLQKVIVSSFDPSVPIAE